MESKSDFYRALKEGRIGAEAPSAQPAPPTFSLQPGERITLGDEATKHDTNKPRYDLIPPEALDGLARLYALGAKKYEDRNWEKGMAWGRVFAAMMRHAWKWFRGETYDAEDGQHHLLSVMWCAMALYSYQARNTGTDDRPSSMLTPTAYETVWRSKLADKIPLQD